ncbi:MAG: hypothetical protein ACTSWT_11520 [Candidatus Heimdallarchaeota archaeon]
MNLRRMNLVLVLSILLGSSGAVFQIASAWTSESSSDWSLFTSPCFSTTQWLSWEAIKLFPDAKVSWITENLYAFWHGVEAPYNNKASISYGFNSSTDYGDIDSLKIGLDLSGTNVIYAGLATRAQEEYNKLVLELAKEDTDYRMAAFFAGTMSHYIGQAGTWYAIWNATEWGGHYSNDEELFTQKVLTFENAIERGVSKHYFIPPAFNYRYSNMSVYYNEYFTVTANNTVAPQNAYNASIALAKQVYPFAENLLVDLNDSILYADQWESSYKDRVLFCLNCSVEAIYAALAFAMETVNWTFLSLPTPQFSYNDSTNYLTIPEFTVSFTNTTGSYLLDDSLATKAEAWFIVRDKETNEPKTLSKFSLELSFNTTTKKWFYHSLAYGATAERNQSIIYHFDMNCAAPTWSNVSADYFRVYYYNTTISGLQYFYNTEERTLDVFNIALYCHDLPEIGEVLPEEVDTAMWHLYEGFEDLYHTGGLIGFPKKNTEGKLVQGKLHWDTQKHYWYDNNTDIGLVQTRHDAVLYVVVRFNLTIPVGYYKTSAIGGGEPVFYPYVQQSGEQYFVTRSHQITITKPTIAFDPDRLLVNVTNIKAWSDYNNTELDYWEMVEKPIPPGLEDSRSARWGIFLYDGIPTDLSGFLLWDEINRCWYANNIDVSSLLENRYYITAKFKTLNTNETTNLWGPASEFFQIGIDKRLFQLYLIPVYLFTGAVILPGGIIGVLILTRARKKTKQ